jgi:hypothetical protein
MASWKVAFCVLVLGLVAHLLVDPFDISSLANKHKEDFLSASHRAPSTLLDVTSSMMMAGNSSLSQVLFDASTSVAGLKRLVALLETATDARVRLSPPPSLCA